MSFRFVQTQPQILRKRWRCFASNGMALGVCVASSGRQEAELQSPTVDGAWLCVGLQKEAELCSRMLGGGTGVAGGDGKRQFGDEEAVFAL